jgi:hypothetical protein
MFDPERQVFKSHYLYQRGFRWCIFWKASCQAVTNFDTKVTEWIREKYPDESDTRCLYSRLFICHDTTAVLIKIEYSDLIEMVIPVVPE